MTLACSQRIHRDFAIANSKITKQFHVLICVEVASIFDRHTQNVPIASAYILVFYSNTQLNRDYFEYYLLIHIENKLSSIKCECNAYANHILHYLIMNI